MKHISNLLLTILMLLLVSACTVMSPTDAATPLPEEGGQPVQPLPTTPTPDEAPGSPAPEHVEVPVSDGGSSGPTPTETMPPVTGGAAPNAGTEGLPRAGNLTDEEFDAQLAQAIERKDFAALRAMMGSQFVLAGWRSEGSPFAPDAAIAQLEQSALASGASPVASFSMDNAALLDGADPLNFFPPDAVRAFFLDFVGPNRSDQALVIIGRDPATGLRYWKGLLVAMGGFHQDGSGTGGLEQFSQQLAQAVEQRDFAAMRGLMRDRFSIATFNATLFEYPADEALDRLRASIFAAGAAPAFRPGTDVVGLLSGRDPLGEWGPVAQPVRAVHVMGLGARGGDEAVLVIARDSSSGSFYWHGVLLPPNGSYFRADDVSDDVLPTDVRYVIALDNLNVRSGPGFNYAVEGQVREGEIATVSGKSPDSAWWQIHCTQDASGRCWISASPELSQPTSAP
jgi:hypothetical protein